MSYISNTAFEVRVSNNEWDNLCNITGMYQGEDVVEDCSAGFLCARLGLLDCEGFAGMANENAWEMIAAVSTTTDEDGIYACNTYDSQLISNGANAWHVGHTTLGLGVPAGKRGTFTRIVFNGQNIYRFGVGNTTDSGAGSYYTIDDGLLTPSLTAPETAGTVYFKTHGAGTFTEGTSDSFGFIDVIACKTPASV